MERIIKALLDNYFRATGVDPACIIPDDRLVSDLAMSSDEIRKFLTGLQNDLSPNQPLPLGKDHDLSLREISALLGAHGTGRTAA